MKNEIEEQINKMTQINSLFIDMYKHKDDLYTTMTKLFCGILAFQGIIMGGLLYQLDVQNKRHNDSYLNFLNSIENIDKTTQTVMQEANEPNVNNNFFNNDTSYYEANK